MRTVNHEDRMGRKRGYYITGCYANLETPLSQNVCKNDGCNVHYEID